MLNTFDEESRPPWLTKHLQILESEFCVWFQAEDPLRCINDEFYQKDGTKVDERTVKQQIYLMLSPYIEMGLAKKTNDLYKVLKMEAYTRNVPLEKDRIHLGNGTFHLDTGEFSDEKEFCLHRLNVDYNPEAPVPVRWNDFLFELLEQDDIPTLQEYMGYCLIPETRAQKMMLLIGKGGEGKSRIGVVMREIFKECINTTSIQKVEHSEFSRADLQDKLVMVDDDMDLTALRKTNYIKTIVTCEGKIDLEKKGVQSYQAQLYVRFLCFGNGALTSINDQSDGFWRRQLLLTTKDKAPDREDDVYLADKLIEEKEGILLWMLEGLMRLIANNFRFTLSARAKENIRIAMRDANNIPDFLESEGYIQLQTGQEASTKNLYNAYKDWCEDNAETPVSMKSFCGFLSNQASRYNLTATNNIRLSDGKRCRGYLGVGVIHRAGLYLAG